MNIAFYQGNISLDVLAGVFSLGANEIKVYLCEDDACRKRKLINSGIFNLSGTPEPYSIYTATPAQYDINYSAESVTDGVPCNFTSYTL